MRKNKNEDNDDDSLAMMLGAIGIIIATVAPWLLLVALVGFSIYAASQKGK